MGNNNQLMKDWSVKFVQTMDDPHFGRIDIYKNLDGQFIMSSRSTFVKNGDDRRISEFKELIEYAKSDNYDLEGKQLQDVLVTPILHQETLIENNLCIGYEIIDIYSEYFNFTLMSMIKNKKEIDNDELWFCLRWLLQLGALLKNKAWQLESGINLNHIFLTLKGKPTIYVNHLHKITTTDMVVSQSGNDFANRQAHLLYEICLCMLCLVCTVDISNNESMELYFRKCEKVDCRLSKIIIPILTKSQNPTIQSVQHTINQFSNSQRIVVASEIKLNKFKYILPKPEIKIRTEYEEQYNQSEAEESMKKQKQVRITSLHGRRAPSAKNVSIKKGTNSDVSVKQLILNEGLNHNLFDLLEHRNNKQNNFQSAKIVNSIAGIDFKQEIENKKKLNQTQKERINERKQMIIGTRLPCSEVQNKSSSLRSTQVPKDLKNSSRTKNSWSRRTNQKNRYEAQYRR